MVGLGSGLMCFIEDRSVSGRFGPFQAPVETNEVAKIEFHRKTRF
jgi:hypothetical protein